ncbi:DNA/RNA non-specific endonuclease [Vitreoscilla sp. C1]|uniref:DNA/RNA non-specific endonuclease n=1 Tax=Vitreoscilla sp. (strain C1) TaxID=96942 RepID=UPI00039ADA46|nr:DNA/RNA non-specific endonuclease [Vitreoscilla sp. C1]
MNFKFPLYTVAILGLSLSLSACLDKTAPKTEPAVIDSKITKNQTTTASHCASAMLLDAIPPQINQTALLKQTQNLCFEQFASLHSSITKGPLWVAEHLTPKKVNTKIKRQGEFHAEDQVPKNMRAELSDYKGSGYDRGHLAPSANMSTKSAQQDSFSLANMVPQNPKNNQNAWRNIEEAVRDVVSSSHQPVYLVTGVSFLNKTIPSIGKNKVLVPSHLYKAVYQPDTGVIGAYWIANTASAKPQIISLCELEAKTGINAFPLLNKEERRKVYDLPTIGKDVSKNGQIKLLKTDKTSECSNKISTTEASKLAQSFS